MKGSQRRLSAGSAIDILEEALHLLRARPAGLTFYYIGSLPFVLGLLFFWTHMSTGADAWRHCSLAASGLVLLFVWMKTWHGVYARHLFSGIIGKPPPVWNMGSILSTAATQTAIQPWSFLLLPLALIVVLPFPGVMAFFQNVTLYGSGEKRDIRYVVEKSWKLASLGPMQNSLIIWLSSPFLLLVAALLVFVFIPVSSALNPEAPIQLLLVIGALTAIPLCPLGVILALNIAIAMVAGPWLLKTFFDIDTVFSLNAASAMNSTFFAILWSLTYLCLDPLLKAAYCLRCFYGESIHSGEDLRVELRALGRPTLLPAVLLALFLALAMPGSVPAQPGADTASSGYPVSVERLDSAIESVMSRPGFTWRMPRERRPEVEEGRGLLSSLLESTIKAVRAVWGYVKKGIGMIRDFLERLLTRLIPKNADGAIGRWTSLSRAMVIIPLILIVMALALLSWRAWRNRSTRSTVTSVAAKPAPDITNEDVDAAALPEEGWLTLARELMAKGDLRLALRALHLATLISLAGKDLITIARYKSDREYEAELSRRSHARPRLVGLFAENRALFERSWYGLHEVTPAIMERFQGNQEHMRSNEEE